MFENLWFWTSWPKKEKILLSILLVLLVGAGVYLVAAYLSGGSFVLDWLEQSVSEPLRVLYDRFNVGLYEFSIFADNYVIVKSFNSSDIHINLAAAYVFLAIFFLAMLFLLALASTTSRFYFILFGAFFMLMLVVMKLENILLFGWYQKETFFLTAAIFLLPAYYLHAFRPQMHFIKRFLIFLAIGVLVALTFHFFAEVDKPFFYLVSYGVAAPLLISVVFILMIGFEVLKSFLTIATKSTFGDGRTNFTHFAILSVIYMGVLTFIFLYNEGYVSWKIIFIDAVWLLLAATIAGFWGFKRKEETYAHIFHFKPVGACVYLTLAIICFSTFAYFFASAIDPFIDVLKDAVIFSQLAYSIIFFVYVLANFFPAMMEGLQVYKIIYKPRFMPYATAVIAALVGVMAFFFLADKAAYYQTLGGYYISLANLHSVQNDDIVAEEYYKLSNIYGRQTHFGNFALAKMAQKDGEILAAENYLVQSIKRNPTEFAFADLANIYEEQSDFFDGLFVLKHGVNYFPDSGPLSINLGKLLSQTDILDSAAYFYLKGAEKSISSTAGLGNIYSLYALANLEMEKDSLKKLIDDIELFPVENNLMVIAAQKNYEGLQFDYPISFKNGISMDRLIYNFNTMLYYPAKVDSATWQSFEHFYDGISSVRFKEELEYAFALAFAKNHNTIAAIRLFNRLNGPDAYGYKKYDLLMAQYFMKYGAPLQALDHYEGTFQYYGGHVLAEMGLALMEAGKLQEARNFWRRVIEKNDSVTAGVATEMLEIIRYEDFKEIIDEDDYVKYNFLRFRHEELSFDEHEGLVLSLENFNLQSAAYIELLALFIREEMYADASRIVDKVSISLLEEEYLVDQYLKQLVLLYVAIEDKASLEKLLPQLKSREKALRPYYALAQAFYFELAGYYNKAEDLYEKLGAMDAFCEECIIKSATYLEKNGQNDMQAYQILVNAIGINKYSVSLNKAYIQKAIELGLESYADDVTEKMKSVLPGRKYREFEKYVERVKVQNVEEW